MQVNYLDRHAARVCFSATNCLQIVRRYNSEDQSKIPSGIRLLRITRIISENDFLDIGIICMY